MNELGKRINSKYQKQYRKANPERVAEWRKNAILRAYIRLVQADKSNYISLSEIERGAQI